MSNQNDKYVMSIEPSGGIYRWSYSIDPNKCVEGNWILLEPPNEKLSWQLVHEKQIYPWFNQLQEYHKDFIDRIV